MARNCRMFAVIASSLIAASCSGDLPQAGALETNDDPAEMVTASAGAPSDSRAAASDVREDVINAETDEEYWKDPRFYERLRACAGADFYKENSDYEIFSEKVHSCYAKVTGDSDYWYYNQGKVETCYRRQHQPNARFGSDSTNTTRVHDKWPAGPRGARRRGESFRQRNGT